MTSARRRLGGAAAAVCVGLALGACASGQDAEAEALGSTGSLAEGSSTTSPADPGGPGGPGEGREVPASCAALTLAPGSVLDGTGLGDCVSQALASFGSGTMQTIGDPYGEVDFTYDPDYSFRGEFTGPDGPISLTFVDGVMWVDTGSGPVKGDTESADPEEQMAGVAAALYRVFSDPAQTASLVAAQPNWTVQQARDQVSLPDGSTVESFKIVSDGPFVWNEIPVAEYILWYGDDWVPVGSQASMTVMGQSAINSQKYYDLGAPITIAPPAR